MYALSPRISHSLSHLRWFTTITLQQQGAGTIENRSWLTRRPLHHILGQTGMLLLMLGTVSVEVLITAVELWARKGDETAAALRSSEDSRRTRRVGSKRQKCRRTTIREPLAKCEGSFGRKLSSFVRPAATAAPRLLVLGLRCQSQIIAV